MRGTAVERERRTDTHTEIYTYIYIEREKETDHSSVQTNIRQADRQTE